MIKDKIDGKKLRQVAGAFVTGVTVITTENKNGDVQGMTASSFVSVSLDPPLVSFCVKEDGNLLPLLKDGKLVGISILSIQQKEISNQFAGINIEEIVVPMKKITNGVSVIENALAWYSTEVYMIIPTGDHFTVYCRVLDLNRVEKGEPLVYWSGYRGVGETV